MTQKSKEGRNVPNLRFPGFGYEWTQTTLEACSESLEYGMNSAAMTFDGKNKYIRITDIDEASSKYNPDVPVSPEGDLEDKYLVKENDILFARTGASTGKSYLYNINDGKLYFAGFLIKVKVNHLNNANFIFNQTKTDHYQRWVTVMSMRSGQPGINSKEYASFKFWVPSKSEQDKIASFFTIIDKRIEAQSKIIEDYKLLKKGLMQKIFKQKIRFKDKDGQELHEWEIKKLSNLCERVSRKNKEDNKNVLTISAQLGLINQEEYFNTSVSAKNVTGYYLLEKNEFAYNKSYSKGYPMGAVKRLKKYEKGVVSTLYICFEFNAEVSLEFMEQYFESGFHNHELSKVAQEGARNHGLLNIAVGDFFATKLLLPSKQEQQKIASTLSAIDDKIELETKLLEQFKTQKQYFLQNLFI
ncbi:restriction endonuclease subunit S [Sinomicrobium pectinilyticum]|uniref:Restriction endonuclease subunit S n=1 Tax=Sinomicrobium pectinilyticum TaxID=1084421 RepID=A0A3N0F4U4_SINP1|nr:restriction endonuclease subunit S [Sinomicrobium pectinilyticum]RNL95183.1 restriction endonuclease subunit S [Sinomicrobium pectinilyticum]